MVETTIESLDEWCVDVDASEPQPKSATETTSGFVGEAHGGILFLDELHALTLECQQHLLRVLNDGTYSRVGEAKELYSDFQVIVATPVTLMTKSASDAFFSTYATV